MLAFLGFLCLQVPVNTPVLNFKSGFYMICVAKLCSNLKLLALILTLPPLFSACSTAPIASKKASSKELHSVNNPSQKALKKIDRLVPHAMKWYDEVANSLFHKGRGLTKAEKNQAKLLGVKNPDAVRVVVMDRFPEPNNRMVNNHSEGARAMGNIILVKPRHKNNSVILCHELVHIGQKDRMGLKNFLKQYALEREYLGYSKSLLENEAYARQQVIQ